MTVIARNGQQWKVSPSHLSKVPAQAAPSSPDKGKKTPAKIILMPKS